MGHIEHYLGPENPNGINPPPLPLMLYHSEIISWIWIVIVIRS